MFPKSASSPPLHSGTSTESLRRYRHDPYGAAVLKPYSLPSPAGTANSPGATSLAPSCAATDTASESAFYEFVPVPRKARGEYFKVLVSFKYGAKEFAAYSRVQLGQPVVTEGDRGEDLGFVERVEPIATPLLQPIEKLIREATESDMYTHCGRAQKEQEALQTMRVLAKQVNCTAVIQDIMYQLDSRKITVIISRGSRNYVDFRRLQRAAYDVFRCRVWCAYLDEITFRRTRGPKRGPPPQY